MGRRHYHSYPELAHITLYRSPALPYRLVVAHTVQQIHRLISALSPFSLHSNLAVRLLWKYHIHPHAHPEYV